MSGSSTKSHKRPHDDINNVNIYEGNPHLSLCKNSRPPKCDCNKPMELHCYGIYKLNIRKNDFLLNPEWYEKTQDKKMKCDECGQQVGEILWVCPDKTCMMQTQNQILLICSRCIGVNGIIKCALCEKEVRVDSSLPCTECKNSLCSKCHHNWTVMCPESKERDISDITCPFCRSNIKKFVFKVLNYRREETADGQSSTTEKEKYETPMKSKNVEDLMLALRHTMLGHD